MDNTYLWADAIEDNFRQTCEYLTHCSRNGIIFSERKFQLCSKEVEFMDYQLTREGMKPTQAMLSSIRNFPRPTNISGIRGWFGLV